MVVPLISTSAGTNTPSINRECPLVTQRSVWGTLGARAERAMRTGSASLTQGFDGSLFLIGYAPSAPSRHADNARNLGFTRRRQCGPCDLNRFRNSLGDFGARLCGIVSCPKRERENGLPTFVEDIKAKAQVRHPRDFAHCAVLVDEARHVFVS